jgi:type II secretory pathway component PulC
VTILLLNGVAVCGLLVAGALTYMSLIQQEVPKRKDWGLQKSKGSLPIERISPLGNYSAIWKMRATPAQNEKDTGPVVKTEETNRDRVLRILNNLFNIVGIIFNKTRPESSYAVLNVTKPQPHSKTVTPGETISGATVEAIRWNEVLFSYQGISVELGMAVQASSFGRPAPHVRPGYKYGDHMETKFPAPGQPVRTAEVFRGSRRLSPNLWQIEAAEVRYVQSQQANLINEYQPTPYNDRSGRQVGVELKKVTSSSYAAQRGFQQGDIIKTINGIPLNSMDFTTIGRRLRGQRTVTVVVLRRGTPVTLTFNMK